MKLWERAVTSRSDQLRLDLAIARLSTAAVAAPGMNPLVRLARKAVRIPRNRGATADPGPETDPTAVPIKAACTDLIEGGSRSWSFLARPAADTAPSTMPMVITEVTSANTLAYRALALCTSKAQYVLGQIKPLGQGVSGGKPIRASRHRCFVREGQSALLGALGLSPPPRERVIGTTTKLKRSQTN